MYKLNLDKDRNVYVVIELNTEKTVYESQTYERAYQIYRKLKEGGGFKGDTPDFFGKVIDNSEHVS